MCRESEMPDDNLLARPILCCLVSFLSIIGIVSFLGGKPRAGPVGVQASEGQPRLTRFINIKTGSTQFRPATLRQRLQLIQVQAEGCASLASRGSSDHPTPNPGCRGSRRPWEIFSSWASFLACLIIEPEPCKCYCTSSPRSLVSTTAYEIITP